MIERLRAGRVPDILIVGGGINGVGVFRDLAAQGVGALLVEAGDFSSGTSAAPSRLIHGGLRYLETGEARLVRESLVERNLLLKNAHHVVHPQPIWVPLKNRFGGALTALARFLRLTTRPGPKGLVPVWIGLKLYDVFGRAHQTMPNHRMLSGDAARREMPVLGPDVFGVGEYYDARITHPERLVLELVADAEADCADSFALPYVAAGAQHDGAIDLTDRVTGKVFQVRPKLVINAAGAWVDRVQGGFGFGGRLIGGTRGTHLVIDKPDLTRAMAGRMLYFETADHRACLALPLDERHLYVGTTDVRTDDPDDRNFTEAEIDYIFDVLRPVLPGQSFDRSEIVFAMAGVRPLPLQKADVPGQISRDHRLDRHGPAPGRPFETLVLVGGKWTTYRAFGEQVVDWVLAWRGRPRTCRTDTLAIGGARELPREAAEKARWVQALAQDTGIDAVRARILCDRYGSGARRIAAAEAADSRQFSDLAAYTPAEIGAICAAERVTHLQDIVLRRTLMGFEGLLTDTRLDEIAQVASRALGWSDDRTQAERAETRRLLQERHLVNLGRTQPG
ncbi:glycerol-3-phosphate dehydrogenase/oxidase [Rhodobacter sp. Har01]|uniref:glycerol-3-phosphate dehydrogenase/oxidase n=1 Tax=Rhodobacter sp. Har01 TaxID=2883999 RepID=UPI001D095D23|nr:glycerol-3-phosphate dehydrogenase/oxidase [Rhodobacter sp. Har01]MCB6178561.1 glycerol-3-phosphate dehydrogenase/oxidase [Rhodobacter sp. Har01]